ncbi:hypothetical protein [Couchioplanes caeruleus]|nr:hypothetical protein [Couchioplanes caeruleus]ROP33695.1 hypothetical protein EDD30_6727 [Couchioplanes caeruleus]
MHDRIDTDRAALRACRRDTVALRHAARQARERAQAMRRDNDERRARMRVMWAARTRSMPTGR